MRTGRLHSYWIVLCCLWITFVGSVVTLFQAIRGKWKRKDFENWIQHWAQTVLRPTRLSLKIVSEKPVAFESNRCYVIMSNHASHFDIPIILRTFPGRYVRMIAKKELFEVPIWGQAMKAADFISVDRNNGRQAVKDLELAQKKMKEGITLWVAPEGTRTRTGKLGVFKRGGFMLAQKTNAIIIPVGIRGSRQVLPPKSLQFGLNQTVEVHIGQPIDTTQYAKDEQSRLIQDIEKSIRQLIDEL